MAIQKMTAPAQTRERVIAWLVGTNPLIVHAWSEKAKQEMLQKQLKSVKASGKEARDPVADFKASLYEMDGGYGFPAMAFKNAILGVAHKDKGIPKTSVMANLFVLAELVSTRPALAGAVCDMPMLRIYGDAPQMREDMVRVGAGLNKVSSLAYRAQFANWAVRLVVDYNPTVIPQETLAFLISEAGVAVGVGDWRVEKSGTFGTWRMATPEEYENLEAKAGF